MTPTQRKAMEMALHALGPWRPYAHTEVIAALRAALANGDNLSPVGQEPFGYFNNPALDGWQDCAPDDEGAIALYEAPSAELAAIKAAIRKLHAAKGRYHTQLAFCDLCELVGLPCERPKK